MFIFFTVFTYNSTHIITYNVLYLHIIHKTFNGLKNHKKNKKSISQLKI